MTMGFCETILIAFGVSIDAAAVSASGSLCPGKYSKRHCAFNAALFFGGFQFFMPLAGFYAASFLTGFADKFDNIIAFILLTMVGGKMIWESCRKEDDKNSCPMGEFFSPVHLIIPAVATSLDALAIGAGLAFADKPIWFPSAAMGIVTAAVSATCVMFGKKLAERKSNMADKLAVTGGVVIILIGVKILLQHFELIPLF